MKKLFESILYDNNENKIYKGDYVDLHYRYEVNEKTAYDGIPTIYYDIYLHNEDKRIGSIDLRLKMDERMYYFGHIGYNISPKYRGNHYSYHACKLLFKIAKEEYDLDELFITCNPDNIASYKTLKKLGCELIEVVQVPKDHELYGLGDKMKCVFRYRVKI